MPAIPDALRGPEAARGCDLCGDGEPREIMRPASLDGPLLRCSSCGLYYVGARSSNLAFGHGSAAETAARISDANARFAGLARTEERRLNLLNARWRLELIRRHRDAGRLLEVGCGRGDFLRVARDHFDVTGIEPSPELAADARGAGPVFEGLIEDAPAGVYDVVASFHVIEHVASPSSFVAQMAERLSPGGLLALETPDIGAWPYRLFRSRWRQFIPEHYYFFDRETLARLLGSNGFEVRELVHVGKYASLSLLLNRLGRQLPFLGDGSRFAGSAAFRMNPGDILLALAVRV